MTKPAGVFLQIVGALFVIPGFFLMFSGTWWPLIVGIGLVVWGGQPSLQSMRSGHD